MTLAIGCLSKQHLVDIYSQQVEYRLPAMSLDTMCQSMPTPVLMNILEKSLQT